MKYQIQQQQHDHQQQQLKRKQMKQKQKQKKTQLGPHLECANCNATRRHPKTTAKR